MASWAARSVADEAVPALIRTGRERLGLSITDAAEQIDCCRRHLGQLEAGQRAPSTALAERIGQVYDLPAPERDRLLAVAKPAVGSSSPYGPARRAIPREARSSNDTARAMIAMAKGTCTAVRVS
jgi:transcriptional regulator with XRE-family HTH domain